MLSYYSLNIYLKCFELNVCGSLGAHGLELLPSPLGFESTVFQRAKSNHPCFWFVFPGM